jgi:Sec-independent protein translocase protein TatA
LPELLNILVVVVLIFGIGCSSKIGSELGSGIRNFSDGFQGDEQKPSEHTRQTKK